MFETVEPIKYLEIARELALNPEPQAQRTAADRAYYSAFLYSRDTLYKKGYIMPSYTSNDHQYVTTSLRQHVGNIGNDENRMRTQRNKVTYDTRDLKNPSLDWMITTADKIIQLVKDLPNK